MRLDSPGQFTHDPNPHPILSPTEALWWRDGSLAIVKLKGGEVLATFPFSQNPNLYLPVRGTDLRWNTFAPKVASAPVPTATLPSAASSSTSSELGRYTLAFIGGAVSNAPQINTIHADGSGLLRPYPTLPPSTSLTQFAWAADGQSLFALDGTQFYQVRKLDSQFFEFALPAGLPGYVTLNGGQIKDFSISPNGRYLAIVYTPMDASIFDLPHAEQRVERDNLGLLDLQQKRWIDVDIPAISSSYAGKAAILFSASAWSKDSQQFVVTVTQYPGETLQKTSNGFALASFHIGGSGSDIVGLVVADVRGKARNITLASNAVDDVTAEFLPFWAQDGQIYFFSTDEAGNPGLYRIAPSGKSQTRITDCEGMDITTPAFAVSPDGRNLAARTLFPDDGSMRLAIINTNSGKKTFLPPEASPLETPVWSPDGKQLAWFGLDESSTPKIFLLNADGSHLTPLSLPSSVTEAQRLTWSPDGIWLAFRSYLQAGGIGLYITRADGADTRLVSSDLLEMGAPQWSPVVITH
jgi:WD40 repeat protein